MIPDEGLQKTGSSALKRGMAEILKGGVIMDDVNAERVKIAEDTGSVRAAELTRPSRRTTHVR